MKDQKQFIEFCFRQHDVVCNQNYDGHPYSYHLKMVLANADRFINLISPEKRGIVMMICAGHDLIEDARMTYNDIAGIVGKEVAEGIFLCTECKGRSRAERKPDQFYIDLGASNEAIFAKVCDVMANTQQSLKTKGSMYEKGKVEYPKIKSFLFSEQFKPMFDELDKMQPQS